MTTPGTPKRPWIGLLKWLVLSFAAAAIGGAVTAPNIEHWYAALAKPPWTPPDRLFGPVWTFLYLTMAVAAWLVWRKDGFAGARFPLAAFGLQLALNAGWSWCFFGLHAPGLAFLEIVLLWLAILATIILFWRKAAWGGVLLLPYFAWVSFAAVLNFAIWRLNA